MGGWQLLQSAAKSGNEVYSAGPNETGVLWWHVNGGPSLDLLARHCGVR